MTTTDQKALKWMEKYRRYTDYIGASQLYLKENFFLRKKIKPDHIKARILGHWGTVPGLNFIYANLNYLIWKHKCEILFIVGPGHGAPAVLANLYAEKTLNDFYKEFPLDEKGAGKLIKDFSWPHTRFPSHVTPTVPGSILEGGELGYSLSTAFGAVLDNPNLIATVVVGDGESETGPLSAAWHGNKFLNAKTSGAVLPIVHINGYKISNPTIYGTMSDDELKKLFSGYGYEPLVVKEPDAEKKMLSVMEYAYQKIRAIQTSARKNNNILKPKWPVILLRTPKGWHGVHSFHKHLIEGSFHSHGVPLSDPKTNPETLNALEKWLKSYKIMDIVDAKGRPKKEVLTFVPSGKYRMGMNKHAIGGNFYKKLKLSRLSKYEAKFKKRGEACANSMTTAGKFLGDVFKNNPKNFRLFCPDELESNKLDGVFSVTKRGYVWPIKKTDENITTDGRVMEMLSEHTLQGFLQGYILTGRNGILVSYEAFATIVNSMVDQYAKFLKQSLNVKWRKPIASAIYLLSSLGWRQDHNGYSHQNPSFVSGILQKHGNLSQIYYPPDANTLLAAFEETMKKKNSICVIVAGKHEMPQWLTLDEARKQAEIGIGIWEWVGGKEASKNPDVVLASVGDYITQEALLAVKMCKELIPELKIRYVNVSELTSIGLGDYCSNPKSCSTETGVNAYFTHDKAVVFSYHGYVNDIEQILWPYMTSNRFTIHGYEEKGSTTTPFDLTISNGVSRYHLVMDMVEQGAKSNKAVAAKKNKIMEIINEKIAAHQKYICENGDDPPELKQMQWC
ncbi:phosphoketolase family protein [Candidatus Peregrinibacteria bacterium]|nr:phosphoketolase family protein [Candidatus Peregrinibacteria bacterium]